MVSYARTYVSRPCIKCGEMIVEAKGPQRYCASCANTCSVPGCERRVRAGGFCTRHRAAKFTVPSYEPINRRCGVEGCGRPLKQKGLCALHYGRAYHKGAVGDAQAERRVNRGLPCIVDGCERPAVGRGYCGTHYARWRLHGDAGDAGLQRASQGEGYVTKDGYRKIVSDGKLEYEHRVVMERKLGRPLAKGANVHHLDGNRANNDPDNLELWITQQPAGQRVHDRVKAAIRLLRDHPELVAAEGVRLINLESQESSELVNVWDFLTSTSIREPARLGEQ